MDFGIDIFRQATTVVAFVDTFEVHKMMQIITNALFSTDVNYIWPPVKKLKLLSSAENYIAYAPSLTDYFYT
jgi:hypothetical protein